MFSSHILYYVCYWHNIHEKVKVKVAQSCPTFCDPFPMDCIVHGILQPRTLEWVAFPFSGRSSQPRNQTQVSHIADGFFTSWATREAHSIRQFSAVQSLSRARLFATPWIAARQASPSITISRSSLRLTSIESVVPSSHLILGRPFPFSSCPLPNTHIYLRYTANEGNTTVVLNANSTSFVLLWP